MNDKDVEYLKNMANMAKALNYTIDVLIAWKDDAEKSKDWKHWAEYNSILANITKLIHGET